MNPPLFSLRKKKASDHFVFLTLFLITSLEISITKEVCSLSERIQCK